MGNETVYMTALAPWVMPAMFAMSMMFQGAQMMMSQPPPVPQPPTPPDPPSSADEDDAKTKERLRAMQAESALSQRARVVANRQTTDKSQKLGLTSSGSAVAGTDKPKNKLTLGT